MCWCIFHALITFICPHCSLKQTSPAQWKQLQTRSSPRSTVLLASLPVVFVSDWRCCPRDKTLMWYQMALVKYWVFGLATLASDSLLLAVILLCLSLIVLIVFRPCQLWFVFHDHLNVVTVNYRVTPCSIFTQFTRHYICTFIQK